MKKTIIGFLALATTMAGYAQEKSQEPFITKTFSSSSIKNVESSTAGGHISVTGIAGNESKVEVYVRPSNSRNNDWTKEQIRKKLEEDYELNVEVSGQKLSATAKSKKRNMDWKEALSISFHIYVSSGVATKLTTSGGNINLSGLSGEQDFTTSGGNLNIDQVTGKMNGRTSGGNINVKNSSNNMDLTTSGGNINAENCNGDITLVTSGGNIQLEKLKGNVEATTSGGQVKGNSVSGKLEAHTSGGNVRLTGLSCDLLASTSGGNIDVEIESPGQYVKLSNSGGGINLQLPSGKGYDFRVTGSRVKSENLGTFKGKIDEDELNGTINGGGIMVSVRASSGRVNVNLK